jgi:hypothetical protein
MERGAGPSAGDCVRPGLNWASDRMTKGCPVLNRMQGHQAQGSIGGLGWATMIT